MCSELNITSPLARMGWGQKIATIALALLVLIVVIAMLGSRSSSTEAGSNASSSSTGFTPQSYSSASSTTHAGRSTQASSPGRSTPKATDGLSAIAYNDLPSQAKDTINLIDAGGPFPYSRDGVVFSNAEGILPKHPRGWYHEYTVKTPGSKDRGARRIIAGQDKTLYYTADHYASFKRVQR